MTFFYFLSSAIRAYRMARKTGCASYHAWVSHAHDIPQCCVFVGLGREAWRITQVASESALQELR
jgi:hypothetical protein